MTRRYWLAVLVAVLAGFGGMWATLSSRAAGAEPIRLGISLSLTGRFAESALYMKEAYELWAREVNESGGIAGRPVELIIYDDESSPDTARVLAERLIYRDRVLMILGPYSSPITDAVATVMERAGVPMLATLASDATIWERRRLAWSFQAFPTSTFDHEGFLEVISRNGINRVAIVYEETPFSIEAKNWAVKRAGELGLTVEAFGYPPGNQDFRSIIERIVAFGAEAVSMGGYYAPSIVLTRQMIERGFNPTAYHFIQAADGVTKDALGANVEAIFGRSPWEPTIATEQSQAFVRAYETAYRREPSYHSAAAYAAGQVVRAAIEAVGTDRARIREFLAASTVPTIMGPYRVDERGRQMGYRYVAIQWQNGTKKIVWPNAVAQAQPIFPKPQWK